VAGKVDAVLVEEGDKVKAGDPIATIDQDTYLVQLRQAEAALKSAELNLAKMRLGSRPEEIAVAQAGVEVARAALDDVATIDDDERTTAAAALARTEASLRSAQSEYDKIAWAGDVGTKPQAIALEQATIAYEDALADYNLRTTPSDSQLAPLIVQLAQAELNLILKQQPFREVDFAIAEAGVEQAQTAVDLVNLQLEDTTITVPFEGIIVDLPITEGSTVGPQSPVAFIVSEEVEVAIELEEGRINQISEGQSVSLQLSAYPDQTFPATVASIDPIADANTRTFTVKITPVDEEGLLKSGMYADVSLLADERTNTVVVPREAIVQQDDQTLVYVIEQGIASQREVETGLSDGQKVEILSGLEPGETVVISGQPNLADGAKVEVVNRL
jgi:multidrug efflux pump subunit AcrA (membrane-fusion protein)